MGLWDYIVYIWKIMDGYQRMIFCEAQHAVLHGITSYYGIRWNYSFEDSFPDPITYGSINSPPVNQRKWYGGPVVLAFMSTQESWSWMITTETHWDAQFHWVLVISELNRKKMAISGCCYRRTERIEWVILGWLLFQKGSDCILFESLLTHPEIL